MITNTINDLPIGFGNIITDYENMDLITPNRLLLGRNNDRSPAATMEVTGNPDRILGGNRKIFNLWFKAWLISHVPRLMNCPKWFFTDHDIKVVMLYYSWKKMGCLVRATSMAWLMKLYPAKMALFVKWLFDIEIIKKM